MLKRYGDFCGLPFLYFFFFLWSGKEYITGVAFENLGVVESKRGDGYRGTRGINRGRNGGREGLAYAIALLIARKYNLIL